MKKLDSNIQQIHKAILIALSFFGEDLEGLRNHFVLKKELRRKVGDKEIRDALKFLLKIGYIRVDTRGGAHEVNKKAGGRKYKDFKFSWIWYEITERGVSYLKRIKEYPFGDEAS